MTDLTQEQIKEIAENLDCGFNCYLHKKANELLFILNPIQFPDAENEFPELEEYKKLSDSPEDYLEIEPPSSHESFKIMSDFIYAIEGNFRLQADLEDTLKKRHPFREFKYVIDNSGPYRQKWFDFKSQKLKEWVTDEINRANALNQHLDEDESE